LYIHGSGEFNQVKSFFSISMDYSASQVDELFLIEVFQLHTLPKTIVSDMDNKFISIFWQEIFRLVGIYLTLITRYHAQKNGKN
jgi:hypothetical protein